MCQYYSILEPPLPPYFSPTLSVRLSITLSSLRVRLLVQNLRLVRTSARHTTTLDDIFQAHLASNLAHALSISSSGAGGSEEDVHFFEGQAFGFREEEVDESGAAEGDEAEEDVLRSGLVEFSFDEPGMLAFGIAYCSVAKVCEHVWCDLADDEIVHPI